MTGITVILLTAAGFLAMVISLAFNHRNAARITGAATVSAAIGGFFVYGYGFSMQTDFIPLAVVRAVMASLGMFLSRSDFSAVRGTPFFTPYTGQFFFWLFHFLALYATASAVLATIGAGALRRLRLWLVRRGDLTLVYGVNSDSVSFGKKLIEGGRHGLAFVDGQPPDGLAGAVAGMGAVLFRDSGAASPGRSFLKSIGIRPGRRHLTVYAMHKDAAQNLCFAADLLEALRQMGVASGQTSLVLSGAEDVDGSRLQALGDSYGYGSVTVFDDATLAARLLVQEYPPCNAVSFDDKGYALQDFEALVVGFGQVGQAVLRHLVMYGQFVGSNFRLAVFAPNCRQVNGCLASCSRALMEKYDISFHPFDARSMEMYRYLSDRRERLKYIVVCTGDTKLNGEIADEISRYLKRLRCDTAVYQCSYQGIRCQEEAGRPPRRKSVYTPDILCPGRMDRMAVGLNQRYCEGNGLSPQENWARCDYFGRVSSRASADFIPALLRAAGRTQEQAMKGDWNLEEELLENLSRMEHLRWCAFHYVMGYDTMDAETYAARCGRYRMEKERERQSRLRIGRDAELQLHACLIPWEQLDTLSDAENAVTGGSVDYKAMDRNNVLAVPEILRAGLEDEKPERKRGGRS